MSLFFGPLIFHSLGPRQCYKYRRYIGNIAIYRDVNSLAIKSANIAPIFSRFFLAIFPDFLAIFADFITIFADVWRYLPIFGDIWRFFQLYCDFFLFFVFFYIFVFFILPMFADIFADKSNDSFLDPWQYIHRHDICNIGL